MPIMNNAIFLFYQCRPCVLAEKVVCCQMLRSYRIPCLLVKFLMKQEEKSSYNFSNHGQEMEGFDYDVHLNFRQIKVAVISSGFHPGLLNSS
jgi:hypothetical protein